MNEKLIIENQTNIPMSDAILYIAVVIEDGRISNKNTEYCYHTSFTNGIHVASFKNKKSDRLIIWQDGNATT